MFLARLAPLACFAALSVALTGCTAEAEAPPPQAPSATEAAEHAEAKTSQKLLAADDETQLYTFDEGVFTQRSTPSTGDVGSGSATATTTYPGTGSTGGNAKRWSEDDLKKDACNFAKVDSETKCTSSFSYLTWSYGKVLGTFIQRSSCFLVNDDEQRECSCETTTTCTY